MKRWHLPSILAATLVAALTPMVLATARTVEAATASVFCDAGPEAAPAPEQALQSYTAINPVRLVDTRNNIGGLSAPIDSDCTMRVDVGTNIPTEATAIALSLTAVSDEADYFTVYPCALGRPETSNLNSRAGVPTPNLVVATPDVNHQICIFSHGTSHLIVDLAGWWSDGPDRFASIEPERVYDSRRPGFTQLERDTPREITIPESVAPDTTSATVVNLTTTRSGASGFMVAYPCGNPVPLASNLNFIAGEDRAVGAIVGLGPGRKLCVLANVATDVIVDVTGYYAPAPDFGPTAALRPLSGRRILDTRNGIGGPLQPFGAFEIRATDPVAGLSSRDEASAVMLNFISTNATADGYLSVFPCGGPVPEVSSLNFTEGSEATNLATVKLGADRTVCILASAPTDIVVDVFAVMAAPVGSFVERMSFDKPVWPAFDPAATDYAIECDAGSGTAHVTVGLELMPFTTASLAVAGGAPTAAGSGTVTVPLRTDQPLVVSTTRQGAQRDYHLRCVPTDFPRLEVQRPGQPTPGWYLTTFGFGSAGGKFVVILDDYGAPVWYKRVPEPMIDLKRLSDGRLAFTPAPGPYGIQPSQGYWVTTVQGGPTDLRRTADADAGLPTDHHDYIEIPGGWALLSYPVEPYDMSGIGGASDDNFADGVIQEVVGGTASWTWRTSEHFDPNESTFPQNFRDHNPGLPPAFDAYDVYHLNSIDRMPDGDYVVGARHLDAVFRVTPDSPTTGKIDWVLGGPAPSSISPDPARPAPLQVIGDPYGGPKRPHDARMVGNVVTMFDNQAGIPGRQSRAVAYRIDASAGTATMLWEFRNGASYTGDTLGSVRQAADGSVLVGWGAGLQPIIQEFAADGTQLMSVGLPSGGNSYRTVKYPGIDFDVNVLRANAGGDVGPP